MLYQSFTRQFTLVTFISHDKLDLHIYSQITINLQNRTHANDKEALETAALKMLIIQLINEKIKFIHTMYIHTYIH